MTELASGYRAGAAARVLAERYDVGKIKVVALLNRAGVPLRHRGLSPALVTTAAELYLAGPSVSQMSDRHGSQPELGLRRTRAGRCPGASCSRIGSPRRMTGSWLPVGTGLITYARDVTSPEVNPTHVLSHQAVRWSIDTLGAQQLHPTFVMYLYLRVQERAGRLEDASASSDELISLIRMSGHPTKPYYFPLIDRGKRTGGPLASFWRASNIPGSWSPGSIRRLSRGAWLGATESAYAFPADHLQRAKAEMLYGKTVSALAMACFFLRNDGFVLFDRVTAQDAIEAFRFKFRYAPADDDDFSQLFNIEVPVAPGFEWFEPFDGSRTSETVI